MQRPKRLLACALALTFYASAAFAQTETGQITGTVLDPTGAPIPNATVSAKDLSTNASRTNKTPDGNYVFPNLQAGRYEVTASAMGFETVKQVVDVGVGAKLHL